PSILSWCSSPTRFLTCSEAASSPWSTLSWLPFAKFFALFTASSKTTSVSFRRADPPGSERSGQVTTGRAVTQTRPPSAPPICMVLGESAAFRVPAINTGCVNMRKNALAPAGGADPAETGAEAGRDKSSRWDHVLTLLATTKRLSVTEVSRTLGVSESTVRRDFMEMERAQLARRTHGGIVAIDM